MFFESSGLRIFSIAGIDVSVSLWYLILMGFFYMSNPGIGGLLFVLAVTISILIHEFGHAVPCKLYELRPSVLLHGFGGLCSHQPSDSDWKDILIVVAGPLVQIAFGLAAFGAMFFLPKGPLTTFASYFAWVSVIWGGINLVLPVYPLDGGQLFHMLLRRFTREHKAQDIALKTSVLATIMGGLWAITAGWWFLAFMAAFITMGNIAMLQSGAKLVDRNAKIWVSDFVKENMRLAEEAFASEDWREAARLCHMLRHANDPIPKKQMDRIWELLFIASIRQGDLDEAKGWLKKAPDTAAVRAARESLDAGL